MCAELNISLPVPIVNIRSIRPFFHNPSRVTFSPLCHSDTSLYQHTKLSERKKVTYSLVMCETILCLAVRLRLPSVMKVKIMVFRDVTLCSWIVA